MDSETQSPIIDESLTKDISSTQGDSPTKDETPESDLDYFSRPENYTGTSNFQTIQRVIVSKEPKTTSKDQDDDDGKPTGNMAFLCQRYREIYPTDEELQQMREEKRKRELSATEDDSAMILKVGSSEARQSSPDDRWENAHTSNRSTRLEVFGVNLSITPGSEPSGPRSATLESGGPQTAPSSGLTTSSSSTMNQISKKSVCKSRLRFGSVTQEVKSKLARERFRHAAHLVRIACRLVAALMQKDKSGDDSAPTFAAIAKEYSYENLKNSGLSFDPTYFKAKVEINLSSEVKNILSLPSEARTPEQIQTAMYGLRSLRSFAEYPLHMQEKLCKVAWFATVTPKRKIIRQGHLAENFYFILSGQAVVTILVKDPNTGESVTRTATIMRRGMSFGELALLHHSRRTATVTTQENVQLLTIGRDDFFDIFMSGQGPGEIPDHIKFVGQLEFMKHWPLERLLDHPEQCLLHFFKRSAVIVKDSLHSDWLYIVKSGSCQVIKTLKGVTPKLGIRKLDRGSGKHRLPKLGTSEQEARVDTGFKPISPPIDLSDTLQRAVLQFKELLFKKSMGSNDPVLPWVQKIRRDSNAKNMLSLLKPTSEEERTEEKPQEKVVQTACTSPPKTSGPGFSKSKFDKFKADTEALLKKKVFDPQARAKERLAFKPPKLKRPKKPKKQVVPPPAKPPPVYVQVESLNPRDVFGLETIQFDNELAKANTSVSLVSRGAECIMLSKEFFTKHANEAVKQMLRKHVRPYPEENTFQENLQTKEDWNLYKSTLIEDIIVCQKKKKELVYLSCA